MPKTPRTIFANYLVIRRGYTRGIWSTYSGHGNDGPLSLGNDRSDRYDLKHHQVVRRLVHFVRLVTFTPWDHDVPFARRLKFHSREDRWRRLGGAFARECRSQKALNCDGRLTAGYAIYRLPYSRGLNIFASQSLRSWKLMPKIRSWLENALTTSNFRELILYKTSHFFKNIF